MQTAGENAASSTRESGERRNALERIDAELTAQSRVEAAIRLQLGQVLELLGRGPCFELGFSSLTAYALERCERSVRWALAARSLAQRLEVLPALRRAVALGEVSWSKAELVAPLATSSDEARWLEAAQRLTVRELRALVQQEAPSAPPASHEEGEELCTLVCTVDREEAWLFEATRVLLDALGTRGADAQVEALLAEAQTTLIGALPPGTIDLEADAPISKAQTHWNEQLARWRAGAEIRCEANLRRANENSEELGRACTPASRAAPRGAGVSNVLEPFDSVIRAATLGCNAIAHHTARELDNLAQSLSRALAQHELTLSRLILQLHRADAWRRLGYATETHYARERLGISRSSFMARRALGVRLESLPKVAAALGQARIGVEAALSLVRIATPSTQAAWLERAQCRTIKHLREEVAAALTARRISRQADCPPPEVAEIETFHELERAATSGRIWQASVAEPPVGQSSVGEPSPAPANDGSPNGDVQGVTMSHGAEDAPFVTPPLADPASAGRGTWRVMLASLTEWLSTGVQTSAVVTGAGRSVQTSAVHGGAPANDPVANAVQTSAVQTAHSPNEHRSAGRVTLRLRVTRATHAWWRGLENQTRRLLPSGVSFLRFCCLSLWQAWRHLLDPSIAYGHIYIRDRHRCRSPVCNRRDVTPHHLKFRSQGGTDDDDNVASVCVWCHLLGIHGGRIRAVGSASDIRWELGKRGEPCLVVQGRQREVAA